MDIYYLILVVPAVILSYVAQWMVQSTFKKYSSKKLERNMLMLYNLYNNVK